MFKPTIVLFLDFGGGEIIIILLVILIVLGPDKIPAFARKAGEVLRYVRKATDDIKREINKEAEDIQAPIKSAYQSAKDFNENAHKKFKATLSEIEGEKSEHKNLTEKETTAAKNFADLSKLNKPEDPKSNNKK